MPTSHNVRSRVSRHRQPVAITLPNRTAAPPRLRSLVVAANGLRDSDHAFVTARAIAERHAAAVQVVSVCEPSLAELARDPWSPPLSPPALVEERDGRRMLVERQMRRAIGGGASWPVMVGCGPLDTALRTIIDDAGAGLIVMGRGRHTTLARLIVEENVLRVLRAVDVPVLASARSVGLPKRAVLAIDFSEHSIDAARLALSLVDDFGAIHLVHVDRAPGIAVRQADAWKVERTEALREKLEGIAALLHLPETANVQCTVLEGYPPHEIATYADAVDADLVVAGTHGLGFLHRLVLGSVAIQLLRSVKGAVLFVPPQPARRATADPTFARTLSSAAWVPAIADFTRAHRNERVIVTTRSSMAGSPVHEPIDGTLLGVEVERGRITVDVGKPGGVRGHRIVEPASVALLVDTQNRPVGMSVQHPAGETRIELQSGDASGR